ncbi:TetR/AcrR family transcriptional regulator [Cellulomonas sp. PhB143]|uniref:TetR/AcrR family transcriptional regulator n=1 Tax=Cellulomonas sp. PhB143 TaxID=2485186 RepID=UPI000F483ECD|nr:TetR family transcriptional regulator C-terminal domain-containing protein [Cellulomonas sp. PhB143]ROS75591.1 TetR family transcriptional regulator [Cellulomonas sp. PhB143]
MSTPPEPAAPAAARETLPPPTAAGDARGRRSRRLDPEERRAQVVATACAIAREDGLAGITMRTVAARAGVAPALVSHYVPSMDELVAEAFARVVSEELDDVTALLRGATADQALERLVGTLMDGTRDDVTLVWVESWALGRRNEALAARVRDRMDAWKAVVLGVIDDGVRAGDLEVRDPDAAAWQVLGMIDGLNAQSLVRWGSTTERSGLVLRALRGMLTRETPRP